MEQRRQLLDKIIRLLQNRVFFHVNHIMKCLSWPTYATYGDLRRFLNKLSRGRMKQVIYNCDICNREIDKDMLISIKIGKNTKHFCQDCINSSDIETLVQEKKDKR